jgi:DNA-binding NarL/FixJ family response regulator
MSIRILIADDHPVVRSGIRNELSRQQDIIVIGEALNGDDALRLSLETHPDVLLLDVNMPGLKAVKVLEALKKEADPCRVLIFSAYSDTGTVLGMMNAGADGYILKDDDPEMISFALRKVAQGERWLSAEIAVILERALKNEETGEIRLVLTNREREVLVRVTEGMTNRQIACSLNTSVRTVEFHVSNILKKLGVMSRMGAALWAKEHGLL